MTTGDVARVCGVSINTAAKWVDTGILKGRRIPGSRHRRIDPADLRAFLITNNMHYLLRRLDGNV